MGISYYTVANAATELSAQGKNPTVEGIRALTGTGSNSTISNHLRAWREKQDQARFLCQKENIPEELSLTVKGLWDRVIDQANEKVADIRQELENKIENLKERNDELQKENENWQQLCNKLDEEKRILLKEKSGLDEYVKQLEEKNLTFTVAVEKMEQQLKEKQERVSELNRMHKQVGVLWKNRQKCRKLTLSLILG